MKTFGLSSLERIKKAGDFQRIFSFGRVIYSKDKKLKTNYIIEKTETTCVKIAAVVNKKAGNAVWRNRIKRLIRAAYRLNKSYIIDKSREKKISLYMVFSPVSFNESGNKKIKLNEIMPGIVEMMNKIKDNL